MADRNKFEEMLERLVNEDKAGAEELFHEIVVEKSRDIYEGLLESDLEDEIDETTDEEVDETKDEEVDEATDEEVDEAKDEEVDEANDEEVDEAKDEETNEEFDLDEFEVAEEDPTDDMMKDMEGGDDADMDMDMDMDDEGDSDEDIEDRVVDLEDALDDLKAEFEKMMSDDDEGGDDDMDMDDEGEDDAEEESFELEATDEEVDEASDEEVDEASDEEVEESPKSDAEQMREYVEKVNVSHSDTADNKKSPVAGKNDMGGSASNIASGSSEEKGRPAPTSKEDSAGNRNTPGGMSAKKGMKNEPGHGAEKKSKPETADNKKPIIGG